MGARHLAHERTALYRLWDADASLLYVGLAVSPEHRIRQHARKPWFPRVASCTVEWHPDRISAHEAEKAAIDREAPEFNAAPGHVPLTILAPLAVADSDGDDGPFAGQTEIQQMLGVSRQRVQQLVSKPDFPAPVERLAMGAFWRRRDVARWAERTGREVRK